MNAEPEWKDCGEEVQVSCNNTTIIIVGVQVNPRNRAVHIETIDLSYVLTRYDNKYLKL